MAAGSSVSWPVDDWFALPAFELGSLTEVALALLFVGFSGDGA